jgi:hypothetical protein
MSARAVPMPRNRSRTSVALAGRCARSGDSRQEIRLPKAAGRSCRCRGGGGPAQRAARISARPPVKGGRSAAIS